MAEQIYNMQDVDHLAVSADQAKRRERIVAFAIGALAIGLAAGVSFFDEANGFACERQSISHYFYEPRAGVFFVMALTFVGAFLFRYRGEREIDNYVASLGALAAMMVAFFPTAEPGCDAGVVADYRPALVLTSPENPDGHQTRFPVVVDQASTDEDGSVVAAFSSKTQNRLHFGGAAAMFLILLYFTTWAFMRRNAEKDEGPDGRFTRTKRFRNTIYALCAAAMVVGGVLILGKQFNLTFGLSRPVFVGEALFLTFFGVSWLVKARFLWGTLDLRR